MATIWGVIASISWAVARSNAMCSAASVCGWSAAGHVFRPGHRILVNVTAPPAADSLYFYVPKRAPAVNTVLHDPSHPSRITLPVVPLGDLKLGAGATDRFPKEEY